MNLCLFIVLFLFLSCSSIPLEFKLRETEFKTYETKICLGTPKKCDYFVVSFVRDHLIAYGQTNYNPLSSTSAKCEDINHCRDIMNVLEHYSIENVYIEKDNFENTNKKGFFRLGDRSKDGVISKLYRLANKRVFYIDKKNKKLVVGDYPEEYISVKEANSFKYCELIEDEEPGFKCHLDSLYFKNGNDNSYTYYEVNKSVNFCPEPNAIYASSGFVDKIIKNYLREQISEHTCERIYSDGFLYVRCSINYDYENDNRLKDITIIFNHFSLRLSPKDLFIEHDDSKYFLIIHNPEKKGWHFGYPFLLRYITLIDEEQKLIGFIPHHN